MGEPFTNPDMLAIMNICAEQDITFGLICNYSRLVTDKLEKMIALGISKIYTNIDGNN